MNPPDHLYTVLATGPSLVQADIDALRHRSRVVAVSDSYRLCPWADAMASTDRAWWMHNRPFFGGRKFTATDHSGSTMQGLERVPLSATSMNSGALGIMAAGHMGARVILMLGFDMTNQNGAHFFGVHDSPLKQTPEPRYKLFKLQLDQQIRALSAAGVIVVNCSRQTAYEGAPRMTLQEALDLYSIDTWKANNEN